MVILGFLWAQTYWHYPILGSEALPQSSVVEYWTPLQTATSNSPTVYVVDYMFDPPGAPDSYIGYNKSCEVGQTVYFPHRIVNRSSMSAQITGLSLTFTVTTAGYTVNASYDVYYDANENGVVDAGETPVTNTSLISRGEYFPVVIQVIINSVSPVPTEDVDCEIRLEASAVAGISWGYPNRYVVDYLTIRKDTTKPYIIAVTPEPDSTGVACTPTYGPITVTFSEEMDVSTVNTSSFYLMDLDRNIKVSGTVSVVDAAKTKFQFFPDEKLHGLTNYMAVITPTVSDLAGNSLGMVYHWKYKTLVRQDEGGIVTFVNSNGESRVEIPPYALLEDSDVRIEEFSVLPYNAVDGTGLKVTAYNVLKKVSGDTDGDGVQDKPFYKDITIKIAYRDNDQDGFVDGTIVREERLRVFYAKDEGEDWNILPGPGADSSNNWVIGYTRTFSYFCSLPVEPSKVALHQSFPNPFKVGRNTAKIPFEIPSTDSEIKIFIYTPTGQLVRVLDEAGKEIFPEEGYAVWDGKNEKGMYVGAGVYIYVLVYNGEKYTGRLSAIK